VPASLQNVIAPSMLVNPGGDHLMLLDQIDP
jgi:hypothetical protein